MKRLSKLLLLLAALAASHAPAIAVSYPKAAPAAFSQVRPNAVPAPQANAQPPVLLALADDSALSAQRNAASQFSSSVAQPRESAFNIWGMLAAAFGSAVMSIVRRMNHS